MPSAPSNSPPAVPPTQSAKKQPEPAEEGSCTCPPRARADPQQPQGHGLQPRPLQGRGAGPFPPATPAIRRLLEAANSLRPAWIGTGTTVALDHINHLIGITALVYLIQQIIKQHQS